VASIEEATRSQIANIEASTGRSFADWIALVRASGLVKHGQIVAMLKADHGIGHGNANLIAIKAREADDAPTDAGSLVDAIYAGPAAALRPLHDAVLERVMGFGDDIELSPKKTYVSLRRRKQFGQVGPASKGRLEVGLNLPDVAPAGRLEPATGMVNRRVRVSGADEIDDELTGWLRAAYEGA
jgi:hypothetical protein